MGFRSEWIAGEIVRVFRSDRFRLNGTDVVTSGEMTHRRLLERKGSFWEGLGRRCLHFTWHRRSKIQLEELDLQVCVDV